MLQNAVNVSLAYKEESSFGVEAGASGGAILRRVSSSLALNKDSFASNEARPDQQLNDARHGMRRVGGAIEVELATAAFDDFLAALLRSTWVAGVSATEADLTSVEADNAAGTFTAGGGSWITEGFKIGDIVRFSSLSETTNNNVNFRITNLTATVMTVYPKPTTMTPDTSFTCSVVGSKLLNGTTKKSYTIEQRNPDIDISELFSGCRIASGSFRFPPNAFATASFEIIGRDGRNLGTGDSPYFTAPTAAGTTGALSGTAGQVRVNGADYSVMTGMDFSIALNMSATPVIGSNLTPEIFYGRSIVTGNFSTYLEDESLLEVFSNETEIDLQSMLIAAEAVPQSFLSFVMKRVKLMGGVQKTIGSDGGVIASFPFQALLNTGGAATTSDTSTIVVQRSN